MEKRVIYLDNNATTKVDEDVLEEILPYFSKYYGNPSSMHDFGGQVHSKIVQARESVKELIGARDAKEIIFTAGGTESANTAIRGVLECNKHKKHIITTKVEHPCVLGLYKLLEKQGYKVDYINVNAMGELELSEVENMVTEDTALVSCMAANNETGVIFPYEKLAEIVKEKNSETKVFIDGVQVAGKIPIDIKSTCVDLMGISGHKFHAPKGVGALYVKSGTMFTPLLIGGHQERSKRAGTENVPGIIGIGKASEKALSSLDYELKEVKRLRDKLESGILNTIYNSRLNTSLSNRVPNTTNIGFEYIEGELILLHLSDIGICASSGSACTSGNLEPSHVLRAMGIPFTALHGSIRFSLSKYTTEEEVDYTIKNLPDIIEKLNEISPFQKELKELKRLKSV